MVVIAWLIMSNEVAGRCTIVRCLKEKHNHGFVWFILIFNSPFDEVTRNLQITSLASRKWLKIIWGCYLGWKQDQEGEILLRLCACAGPGVWSMDCGYW